MPRPTPMTLDPNLIPTAHAIESSLRAAGVRMTLGGEPTLVPIEPEGAEWNFAAVGPTKLRYAYALAAELTARDFPGAAQVLSPGKRYPGELNPRWTLNLLWNQDGSPLTEAADFKSEISNLKSPSPRALAAVRRRLEATLGLPADAWLPARDTNDRPSAAPRAWVLPLDHDGERWLTDPWTAALTRPETSSRARPFLSLVNAAGPAGLRLPLNALPENALRRALTLETDRETGILGVFLPPLLQGPWIELFHALNALLAGVGVHAPRFEGYLPPDEGKRWGRLGLTADPGVLEINLPPCERWEDYAAWLRRLETAGAACGLRSFKRLPDGTELGSGGGNHLLFGGPSLEENPFFTRPAWVAGMMGYFQAHPCLAYAFTGQYVGPSSQAPRPDESARDLFDLEMAYRYLASLPAGEDHRQPLGETLRHLHVDVSGNTHRSEISFDKFWNAAFATGGGTAGLMEFRAIESLPRADWMAMVALLWQGIAALTLERSVSRPLPSLTRHGGRLHDAYFLPTPLWEDLCRVLDDLRAAGFGLDPDWFRPVWDWRFPVLLATVAEGGGPGLTVRRACEPWPLLSEEPLEGGATSRFVDTSVERLEFSAPAEFMRGRRVFVNGRELPVGASALSVGHVGCGLRYRRTALYPSLHPGIAPQLPLEVTIVADGVDAARRVEGVYRLETAQRVFTRADQPGNALDPAAPCRKSSPELITCDLRLPAVG